MHGEFGFRICLTECGTRKLTLESTAATCEAAIRFSNLIDGQEGGLSAMAVVDDPFDKMSRDGNPNLMVLMLYTEHALPHLGRGSISCHRVVNGRRQAIFCLK